MFDRLFSNVEFSARCLDGRYINGQLKLLEYQKVIFIQKMDMPRYCSILVDLISLKKPFP